ncbi:MAG: PD-(D/E)XK nuclease family protein [Prolixibacteraceae bacterium]
MDLSKEYFLKQLADSLYKTHGQNIVNLTIVFPNRRAGLFFTEYLNRIIKVSTFSPEIITIQELFSNISSLRSEEPLQHIFRLFKIYKELSGSKETFDEFYLWGEMLLHDFDQVDKYLVDAELLFTNITDLKEIDEHFNDWNDDRKEEIRQFWKSLTDGEQKKDQKEFSRLWQVLFPIYQKLKKELYEEGIAYEGMLFREAVENQDNLSGVYLSERKFVVAGFNALNNCEKRLFLFIQSNGNIEFYWDFDNYYLDDLNQEAGLFMRENLKLFPQTDFPFGTDCFKRSKNIQIFNSPSQIGQTQIAAGEIAKMVHKTKDFHDTAIVLCDEELLLPVISAIPKEIETVNVTMGLPLKQTPLYSLISLLISLQRRAKRDGEKLSFHYKSVSELLNNQFIQSIYPIECKLIVENIIKNNLLYVPIDDLGGNDLFKKIFVIKNTVADLPDYFLAILFDLFLFWEKNKDYSYANNYQEYIYQVYLSVNKLNNSLFVKGKAIMGKEDFLSQDSFFKIMLQYLEALSISFEGEPLAGLQIMGILETRALDFQNIVLLSVNEGIMPKANTSGSFIPYHLRKGVGLPTVEEQNAMYAYYFYRLLQRAETITFVYNSGSSGLKTGEKSRFLHQLQLESTFSISEEGIENTIDPVSTDPIIIEKKGRVLEMLNDFLESGKNMTPTALVQYVQCPLSYYFKYIARFEEEDEVTEEVDARIFGTLFHSVMETLYKPYMKRIINESIIQSMVGNDELIESSLMDAFSAHFFKYQDSSIRPIIAGRNRLVFEVIKKMVVQTLRIDSKKVPFKIEGLELRVGANVSIFKGVKSVRLGGVIDRIDSISGTLEIIDYKTGTTDHYFNSLAELFDKQSKKRNKAVFQTLIYSCIWDKMHPESGAIYPGIYALKTIFQREQTRIFMKDNGNLDVNYQDIKEDFEPMLTVLLEEIFNPMMPFVQTTVEENCQYCQFVTICGKPSSQS